MTIISIDNMVPIFTPVVSKRGVETLKLVNNWKVYIDKRRDKYVIVPAGAQTNFATIPWMFRWIMSRMDPTLVLPAIVHDYLVQEFNKTGSKPVIYSERMGGVIVDHHVDWWEAAEVFKDMIRMYRGSAVMAKSNIAYFALWVRGIIRDLTGKNKRA